ncbi:tectonin domain-containing protein [Streptomyces sp. RKAG293]|uniref:tectonin domain-containing protein n=1 Tax=Streptomyces sp. RKAG293 TaxID=2893403 RepID=UPI0020349792|nr:tectonin domain-containing protein [Streptomyces sp. RKAG293]MCM2416626.1 hypothetical protein [Streptomyces sp. RKAG293]
MGKIQTFYQLFNLYVLGNKPPSELDAIKAAIAQAQAQIVGQIDAVVTANVNSEADLTVEQFENIDTMTPDQLAAFVNMAVKTVTDVKADIPAEQTPKAQDQLGFDLNIVGPIALFASAKAGQHTDILTTDLIQANQEVVAKQAPKCGVFPISGRTLNPGEVDGIGHCFGYQIPFPTNPATLVPATTTGNIGSNPFTVTGSYDGFHVTMPTLSDYTIASDQAVASTSSPLATAALSQLMPAASPVGSKVATAVESGSDEVFKPIETVTVDPVSGAVALGAFTPDHDGNLGAATFGGWKSAAGVTLKSVASATNSDGRVEMFGLDNTGNIHLRWQLTAGNDGTWSPWTRLGGGTFNSIGVARNQNGSLQVIGTSTAGTILTTQQIVNGDYVSSRAPVPAVPSVDNWTPWTTVDGALTQVSAVTNKDGKVELFGVNSSGSAFHAQQTGANANTFTTWTAVPHTGSLTAVTMSTDSSGRVNLFATDAANRTFQTLNQGTSWTQIPGTVHAVSAVKEGGGAGGIELVGLDAANNTVRNYSTGGLNTHGQASTPVGFEGWTTFDHFAYQNSAGHLSSPATDGFAQDLGAVIKAGTTPATVRLSNGGYQTAFVGTNGNLWLAGKSGAKGTDAGHKLWPGTSPSIAADSAGGWMVTFQDDTSRLWTLDSAGNTIKTNSAMNTGTSPSIAHLSTGGYEIAFVGSDGKLYSQDAGIPGGTSHPIGHIPASSPAIAADANGGWKIAFEGNTTNHLVTYDSHGTTVDTTAIMWPATSPAITALATGGYETVINAWDGNLAEVGDGGNRNVANNLPIAPGTSPTIVALPGGGFEMAFHGTGDHLRTASSDENAGHDTGIVLAKNTNATLAK